MKAINFKIWYYKGYFIQEAEHPLLYGKYEIYKDDELTTFVKRVQTIFEAKKIITDKNFL